MRPFLPNMEDTPPAFFAWHRAVGAGKPWSVVATGENGNRVHGRPTPQAGAAVPRRLTIPSRRPSRAGGKE
jgi:hypothetical protein